MDVKLIGAAREAANQREAEVVRLKAQAARDPEVKQFLLAQEMRSLQVRPSGKKLTGTGAKGRMFALQAGARAGIVEKFGSFEEFEKAEAAKENRRADREERKLKAWLKAMRGRR